MTNIFLALLLKYFLTETIIGPKCESTAPLCAVRDVGTNSAKMETIATVSKFAPLTTSAQVMKFEIDVSKNTNYDAKSTIIVIFLNCNLLLDTF